MVKISLPLSATALRHGSDLLLKLAADAETIRHESATATPARQPSYVGSLAALDLRDCSGVAPCPAELLPPPGIGPLSEELAAPAQPGEFAANSYLMVENVMLADIAATDALGQKIFEVVLDENGQGALTAEQTGDVGAALSVACAPPPAPVLDLQMTDKAGAWSLAEFREQGWTDDNLVEAGYAERVARPFTSAPVPAVPSAPPAPDIAPSANSNSGASSTASVELDKNGLPWDARIHSDAANKLTAEGRWKRKRGVADELVTQVEAELRAVMAVPSPVLTAANQMSALSATLTPIVPDAPIPGGDPATFPALTLWLSGHLNGGRIAQADVALAVQSTGLALLPDLNKRPDLIPAVVEHLRRNRGL